ncbi:hypothetical protein [Melittangium boletus]|uniref:hypothetical protein n=1 Tax=Melittangium boletus TaxID=83453 RepID=UPI003DA20007
MSRPMSPRPLRLLLALTALAVGCVTTPTLRPTAEASTTAQGVPVSQEEGVRLVARGDAWRGVPSDLGRVLTPVQVRLENHGERPLRIDPADFTLVGGSRFEYAALQGEQIRDESLTGVGGSGDAGTQNGVAARPGTAFAWGPWFRGTGWYSPMYDPFFSPYSSWGMAPPEPLPTRDMLREALPQGTLPPGGSLTGFLYFQGVGERERQVTLRARLVDARTGEAFGTLEIPFDVRS